MNQVDYIQWRWTLLVGLASAAAGCRQESNDAQTNPDKVQVKPAEVLIFPEALRTADPAVNDFVTAAMTTCAKGDYEAFRLLWSARETPLPREEFDQGWNAARRIEVRGLRKGILPADREAGRENDEAVYALFAEVEFDPTLRVGQKQPVREVVLMLTLEQERWRIAKAPRAMREWIKSNVPFKDEKNARPGGDEP